LPLFIIEGWGEITNCFTVMLLMNSLLIALVLTLFGSLYGEEAQMKISSTAFGHNGQIPTRYTCEDSDVNPPLRFEGVPADAKSLALIVDDPDAPMGTWVHWVVWNIDPKGTEIKENSVPKGSTQGMNDFRKHDYGGPCPPSGTHRYFLKLYALDMTLNISANTTKATLESAMKGHILAEAQLIGLYTRSR
jgi:Raf kinase inhibitor-like YbhB/YbcL family protein